MTIITHIDGLNLYNPYYDKINPKIVLETHEIHLIVRAFEIACYLKWCTYKYWLQTHNVDDHLSFGDKTQYYLQRDFIDLIYDFHVDA